MSDGIPAKAGFRHSKTQNNLGGTLETLGERESRTARLKEAVTALREALRERTRARVPLDWAMTQMNLGNVFLTLGERESGTAQLEEAAAYREALQEYTRARGSFLWAQTQQNITLVHLAFFRKDRKLRHLDAALESVDGALEEYRKANAAFYIDEAERVRQQILEAKGGVRHG